MPIIKYLDFLLEKLLSSLNESVVQYSDKFEEILYNIDSPIAKQLLDLQNKDKDVKTNWFDVGKDGDHLTFLVDAKAQKMENKKVRIVSPEILTNYYYYKDFFDQIGFDRDNMYFPIAGEVGEIIVEAERKGEDYYLLYIDSDKEKQVVIKKRFTEPDSEIYWTKNRQEIKIGRGIRSLLSSLNIAPTDAQLEDFVNKYKSAWETTKDGFSRFELVDGVRIAEFYNSKSYADPDKGELGKSCMKEKPTRYFDLYVKNPSVCSLLILKSPKDTTKIIGRALVWKLTSPEITYMDRIYANKPAQVQLFRDYAKSQGWYFKSENSNSDSAETVAPDGTVKDFGELRVFIRAVTYNFFPYVDTLKYLYEKSRYYILSTKEDEPDKILMDTDGNWQDSEECETCGGSGRAGCEDCDATGEIKCGECEGGGEIICTSCEGKNSSNCRKCQGNQTIPCKECKGGKYKCETCDGDGWNYCPDC